MKKLLVTILSIIYLTTTTGFTLNIHYCMGKPVNWAPLSVNGDKCSNCSMNKSDAKDSGCCKDEHKQVKLDGDQKTEAIALKFLQIAPAVLPHSFIEVPGHILSPITLDKQSNNLSLQSSSIPFYIRNCVFLI